MRRALIGLARRGWSYALGVELRRLAKEGPTERAIAGAVKASLRGTLNAEERRWIRRIEARRAALLGTTRTIQFRDFGAGAAGDERDGSLQREGVEVTGSVAASTQASKPPLWAQLLFHLARRTRPAHVVELGSCVGISAAHLAAALALNGHGELWTLEGAPPLAELTGETLSSLGLERAHVVTGRFADTLEGVLNEAAPVDFAFVDGHHDEAATVAYFEQILPSLAPNALVVFDDVRWSAGMLRAFERVALHPRIDAAVDCGTLGICVVTTGTGRQRRFRLQMR